MIVDIVSSLLLILIFSLVNRIDKELEIKRLIKEIERGVIIDVEYKIITSWQLYV